MPLKAMEDMAARICLVGIALVVIAQPVLLFQESWTEKLSLWYTINVGLFQVRMGHGVVGMAMQGMSSNLGKDLGKHLAFDKTLEIQEFQNLICSIPQIPGITLNMCMIFQNLLVSSWALIIGMSFGISLYIVAAILIYYYAFVKARKMARLWALAMLVSAPFVMTCAVAQYMIIAYHVADMPPMTQGSCIGMSANLAGAIALFSWLPAVIFAILMNRTSEEHRVEFTRDLKAYAREEAVLNMGMNNPYNAPYGAVEQTPMADPQAGYGGEMPYGGYGGYPAQQPYAAPPPGPLYGGYPAQQPYAAPPPGPLYGGPMQSQQAWGEPPKPAWGGDGFS